ncbi:MAG: NUDIX hydrolase [Halobacteriaceae archaeon]
MGEELNRASVEDRIARLTEQTDELYREEETVVVPEERFPDEIAMSENGYVGSAYGWVIRRPDAAPPLSESMRNDVVMDRSRVLMILGRGGTRWGIPGGGIEDGETCEETVVREVQEETGIECTPTQPFGIRHERRTADGFETILHTLRAVFDARFVEGRLRIQPGELAGAAWFAERSDSIHPLARPRAARWFNDEAPDQ